MPELQACSVNPRRLSYAFGRIGYSQRGIAAPGMLYNRADLPNTASGKVRNGQGDTVEGRSGWRSVACAWADDKRYAVRLAEVAESVGEPRTGELPASSARY